MPTLKTWTGFSKRRNSTKQPSQAGTDIAVKLKEDTSIESPVFILQGDQFNIDYVQAFGAYYFVSNTISLANGLTELHCEKDPMATYKSEIGSTPAFILYATGGSNYIPDTRLSMKSTAGMTTPATASFPWTIDPLQGKYLLTVMGNDPNTPGDGGVNTFVMTASELSSFMSDISSFWDDIFNFPEPSSQDVWDYILYQARVLRGVARQIVSYKDASSCILRCKWLPLDYNVGSSKEIFLGNFDTGHQANRVFNLIDKPAAISLSIPWAYNDWRNCSPYTEVYLYIPFLGVLHFDPSSFHGLSTMTLQFAISRATGDCSVEVSVGNIILGTYTLNIAAEYAVGAFTSDPVSQVITSLGSIGAVAGGIATGNAPAIIGGVGGLASSAAQYYPTPTHIGGLGGGTGAGLETSIKLWIVTHDTSETPGNSNATLGKPVMATHQISNYSGYIQCSGASVSISGESVDRDAINSFLNGGFFYE